MKDQAPHTRAFRTFVIRAWREDLATESETSWRFSLQDIAERARAGFVNSRDLAAYLEKLLGLEPDEED
jgi:hypothetical protein